MGNGNSKSWWIKSIVLSAIAAAVFILPAMYHNQSIIIDQNTHLNLVVSGSISMGGYIYINNEYALFDAMSEDGKYIADYLSRGTFLLKEPGSDAIKIIQDNDTITFKMYPFEQ